MSTHSAHSIRNKTKKGPCGNGQGGWLMEKKKKKKRSFTESRWDGVRASGRVMDIWQVHEGGILLSLASLHMEFNTLV